MIKKIQETIFKNQLAIGRPINEIKALPILSDLTSTEFKQLINRYTEPVSPYEAHQKAIKVKNPYPSISFKCSNAFKTRWVKFVDSKTSGLYSPHKQKELIIDILTKEMNKEGIK